MAEQKKIHLILPSHSDSIIQIETNKDAERELIAIKIKPSNSESYNVLRFSSSYLESKGWKMEYPLLISDTLRFRKLAFKDEVEGLYNHSYYFLDQELYNSGKYPDCIAALDSLSPQTVNLINYGGRLSDLRVDIKGMLLLAYLSAEKLGLPNKAQNYWDILEKGSPAYTKFLKENDFEISKYNPR